MVVRVTMGMIMTVSGVADSAQAMASEDQAEENQHDSRENTESGRDPILIGCGERFVRTPFDQGQQNQTQKEDTGSVGDGDDDSQYDGVPYRATGSHQIGCDHRLSMTGA